MRCERFENAELICRKPFRSASERWQRFLGSTLETVEAGCAEAAEGQVCSPANINSPSQVVIAGNAEAVDRACEILKEKGAKRAIKLNVSAPFHCALMMPAQERLADDLADIGVWRVCVSDRAQCRCRANNTIRRAVADKLDASRFHRRFDGCRSIENYDWRTVSRTFIEIGPGKVLTGWFARSIATFDLCNIENTESLRNTLETL